MNETYMLTKIKLFIIKEDIQYEYLIPAYPFCSCKFDELEQKCKELKERLPEDVVDVYVPNKEEVMSLPEEIRKCGDCYWSSTVVPYGIYAYCMHTDGYLYYNDINGSYGFRPIIVRQKHQNKKRVKVKKVG